MSEWAPKRFWTDTTIDAVETGFVVLLDGRLVRTPAKAVLTLPTRAMAQAVAMEWDAQGQKVDPATMPNTRSANAAIDKVSTQHGEVADMIADYGGSDLLCYRADAPEALSARQAQAWDPMLDWASTHLGARLDTTTGVMHLAQCPQALKALRTCVHGFGAFCLTAVHDLVGLSGSLILGLAATTQDFTPEALWKLSRIDEDWQIEQWGRDEEAEEMTAAKRESFFHAHRFYRLAQSE